MPTSSGTSKPTKASTTTTATQLIAGFQKHLANMQSITLASVAYSPAQITAALQLLVMLIASVDAAKAVVQAKLAAENAQAPALRTLMTAVVTYVKLTYSESPDVLADFGLQPKKARAVPTTEQKVVAVAKRKSTRSARGTTSKKAKLALKGNVVDVVLTPVSAPLPVVAPSAASNAPAPSNGTAASAPVSATSHGA